LPIHENNDVNPFTDETQVMDETVEEAVSEVTRILQDVENGVVDPSLPMLGAEDVALDMDESPLGAWQEDDSSDMDSSSDESGEE
jgi:hypothetical protein